MFFRYVAFHYLKNMFIILLGLSGIFTGLDYLMNGSGLPSFNIKVLYAFSRWEEAINLLYPLAIIFGGVWTKISFIKQNVIGSFYALGVTRREFFKPFLIIGLLVYLTVVGLNFTAFAKSNDRADMLKKHEYSLSKTEDLFFKYSNKYSNNFIYIGTLLPELYKLENLTIFRMKNHKVYETLTAKEAWFNIHEWVASDVTKKTKITTAEGIKLKIEKIPVLFTLRDYEPKILKSIYSDQQLTLTESLKAKTLLDAQGLGTGVIRSDIYSKVVTPLFSIALLMILIFRFPFHARYMNIATTTMQALGGTLFIWGILFALQRMGMNGTVNPELVIVLPVLLLWIYAIYTWIKADSRI